MDNAKAFTVIRQLFSFLPVDIRDLLPLQDRYSKKLTLVKTIMVFLAAQWNQWSSYGEMETQIRAHSELRDILQLDSISGSQLSRKLDEIPTELLEALFQQLAARAETRLSSNKMTTDKLHIIDSTRVSLPLQLGDWARMTKDRGGVKMHLRLVAGSPDHVFPSAMVPSTMNVDDRIGAVDLVAAIDAIYVMDRGYDHYKKMDMWIEGSFRFVIRMRERTCTATLEEFPIPEGSGIHRDAKVRVGSGFRQMEHPVRLIEFFDEKGRLYRLFTSIWDKTAEEIADIYKKRWLIELYFKWMKQHLRLKKVHSYKPRAIWNQLFLVLIAAMVVDEMKVHTQTNKRTWTVLRTMRAYMYLTLKEFVAELNREPSRTSKGKPAGVPPKEKTPPSGVGVYRESKYTK